MVRVQGRISSLATNMQIIKRDRNLLTYVVGFGRHSNYLLPAEAGDLIVVYVKNSVSAVVWIYGAHRVIMKIIQKYGLMANTQYE